MKCKMPPFCAFLPLLVPILLLSGGLFFCCHSPGFNLGKISSTMGYREEWEIPPLSHEESEILTQKVFPQVFYYMAAGNQCYAFISEDRQYVLKFFKMQNLLPKSWSKRFPFSLFHGDKAEASKELLSDRVFTSYKDAYENLRAETGLLFLHFNKTRSLRSQVTLIDSKGRRYRIDLDGFEFVVQRRAQKVYDRLAELCAAGMLEDARDAVHSFFHLFASRCEKGFASEHLSLRNNFGFIGNRAMQIDCSFLTPDSSMKYPSNFREEIMKVAEKLDSWASAYYPELSVIIQQEAQEVINHAL
ncbi:MAG: hypothetical protein JSS61_04740 [Verrucomicrobia bacterium]|nr:hypothetical protein [Verrucomicrobiota bacterium]